MKNGNLFKWEKISETFFQDMKIFFAKIESKKHLGSGVVANFTHIDSPNWVSIIPITTNQEVVLVRQFRHGINDFTIEFPGGLIDFGEQPKLAAVRECIEETGYKSIKDPIFLGECFPNSAFMNNMHFSFLWEECEQTEKQNFDTHEEIELIIEPIEKLPELVKNGIIKHSLNLSPLLFYMLHKGIKI